MRVLVGVILLQLIEFFNEYLFLFWSIGGRLDFLIIGLILRAVSEGEF
mgnify:CR=1 FL=1